MGTVTEIIEAVRRLNEEDKGIFLEQLANVDFDDAWDRRMESDAKAGHLDFLVREAEDAARSGTLRDWPDGSQT